MKEEDRLRAQRHPVAQTLYDLYEGPQYDVFNPIWRENEEQIEILDTRDVFRTDP